MKTHWQTSLLALVAVVNPVRGVDLTNVDDAASVKQAAATIANGMLSYYTGMNPGDVPGNLPAPYYWWEAGGFFGTLIDYWYFTGDSSHNNITLQAIVHQAGDKNDFMPKNQTSDEGNDDQGFWALTAMNAAEQNFVDPPAGEPQWTALVQAVYNEYVTRWDTENCGGGMRWQISSFLNGWNYKNTVANGCFFNIAARLGRYTGNQTYIDWATKIWDWAESAQLIGDNYAIYDGTTITDDHTCPEVDHTEWSYNSGLWLHGSAAIYNVTNNGTWKARVDGILSHATTTFVKNGVINEQFCETADTCDQDQQSFKGYFARFLRATSLVAPHTADQVLQLLKTSAPVAAGVCIGSGSTWKGTPGQACGFSWQNPGKFDGQYGVGEQMNALSNVIYTLDAKPPVTLSKGGTSKSDPNAGNPDTSNGTVTYKPISETDKAAAGIITTVVIMLLLAFCFFLILDVEPVMKSDGKMGMKLMVS